MQTFSIGRFRETITHYRPRIQECLLVLALMAVATLIAYEYDLFPNSSGGLPQEHVIDSDEIIALAGLLCVCLLVLAWRFLLQQRREMALRIEAEHRLRELTR
jgi:DMSO/TMAO reductase YedYZ heme-binding membrane subunit